MAKFHQILEYNDGTRLHKVGRFLDDRYRHRNRVGAGDGIVLIVADRRTLDPKCAHGCAVPRRHPNARTW